MKSVLRATAILASSSAVTVVTGIVTAKAWALIAGPGGLGYLGLLQSMAGLGAMVAAMGLNTGVVRMGASALGRGDEREAAAVRRAAVLCTRALAAVVIVGFVLFRRPLAEWALDGAEHADAAVLAGVAAALTLLAGVEIGVLNAYHRVAALARASILGSVAGAASGIALLWFGGRAWLPATVVCVPLFNWAAAAYGVRREVRPAAERVSRRELADASRALFRFGVPYMGSMVVGSGVQLALPLLVGRYLETASVGYLRAATSVAVGYLGFLLTAIAQDYYPRVAAAAERPGEINALVNQQLRLLTLVGLPVVGIAQVSTPLLVPLLYSHSFAPTTDILRWMWMGNLFKLWSWGLSYVILARSSSRTFFAVETVGGVAMLVASVLGMKAFGLTGLGMGFAAACVVYAAAAWGVVWADTKLAITASNRLLMAGAFVVVVTVHLLPHLVRGGALLAVFLAGAASLACALLLWQEYRAPAAPAHA